MFLKIQFFETERKTRHDQKGMDVIPFSLRVSMIVLFVHLLGNRRFLKNVGNDTVNKNKKKRQTWKSLNEKIKKKN